jgi:ATP phosphoribosyltransferase regulatory subunit
MQAPQPKISGTRDYTGEDAVALRTARDAIAATLRRYAYAAIDPPILERSSPFLNRSGEDIRRHMYIFADPGGREVCLRPELTIPVCRAYLRQLQSPENEALSPEREARLCYFGPAFRYESAGEGQDRQFYQAGAELIGAKRREAADAEVLAAALDCLQAAGVEDASVEIGDVDIRSAFIDQLAIGERSKTRLRRLVLGNRKEVRLQSAESAKEAAAGAETLEFTELASLLASVAPGKAERLIREVFALADVRHVGGRTPEEIVERLTSRTAQQAAEPISTELLQGVSELLDIRADPAAAFAAVREHFRRFGLGAIDPVLERCENRLRFFNAYRQSPAKLKFNVGLRRGLEYYTGFLFEIFAPGMTPIGHLCGGGRYDNLLEGLGANFSVPAVGFAIGLDRLVLALRGSEISASSESLAPRALVVAAGTVPHEDCISVSVALRNAGWSVETDTSGRRARSALGYALKRKIPYVVFVGEDELKNGSVRIKRLTDRNDQLIALSALEAYAKGESARELAGGTP